MIIPIRCYTCSKLLADKYEYYESELLRKKLAMKNDEDDLVDKMSNVNLNKDPLIININASDIQKTIAGEIMDELGLIRICCRKVMLTSINIIDEI
jgi:DNA-directed RNA polymerase subunit N (RpoN/RPB10)